MYVQKLTFSVLAWDFPAPWSEIVNSSETLQSELITAATTTMKCECSTVCRDRLSTGVWRIYLDVALCTIINLSTLLHVCVGVWVSYGPCAWNKRWLIDWLINDGFRILFICAHTPIHHLYMCRLQSQLYRVAGSQLPRARSVFSAARQTHAIAIIILSVRLSVTLVIRAYTVQYIEICSAPKSNDRATFLAFEASLRSP